MECSTVVIQLTRGKSALIDDIDIDLANHRWHTHQGKGKNSRVFYAKRRSYDQGVPGKWIRMHRLILSRVLGRELVPNEYVDHINHDGLDNRRSNLRLSTKGQNAANTAKCGHAKSSRFRGVSWDKANRKWEVGIYQNGRRVQHCRFDDEIDAARAYDVFAKELFGEFACTNFLQKGKKEH